MQLNPPLIIKSACELLSTPHGSVAARLFAETALAPKEQNMICTPRSNKHRNLRNELLGVPSTDRIRHLAKEIRSTWSPATRARRAAEGCRRVEVMLLGIR